jgi:uncharacterized glyoxalase superfamily protein PhnB
MRDVNTAKSLVTGVAPMFLVDDVVVTAEWYRDALGFTIGQYYSEDHDHDEDGNDIPGSTVMLGKTVQRGLGVASNRDAKEYSSDAYFWCEGVDALYAHAKSAGAEIVLAPETQFYGMREFMVRDPDGRVITFGAPVGGG